ncbi:MAG TPA: hypothetical protein VIL65_11070 [Beijerinckiaceae bacterium]
MSGLVWTQEEVAGVPLRRSVGRAGAVEAGAVEFDGSNGLWVWSSPLAEDAWGWAPTEAGARQALELWLKGWLENFRALRDGV